MSRLLPILFRAKRADNGEWIEGLPSYDVFWDITNLEVDTRHSSPVMNGTFVDIDPRTLCRRAGAISGREIWENDICQWIHTIYGKCTGVVRYGEWIQDGSDGEYDGKKCLGWYLEVKRVQRREGDDLVLTDEEAEEMYPEYLRMISLLDDEIKDLAVIGNILDNPELLEVTDNE